ncbi:MAG: MerR family transcriptional regulator [Deltaproteobacteria bacterium]
MIKLLYKTQEVANIVGVSKKTIFNWLEAGKIPEPRRNEKNNYREWTVHDIAFVQSIKNRLLLGSNN